jgi:type IV pilus assembly protein PilB
MASQDNITLTGLARKFVHDQLIDEDSAKKAQAHAQDNRISLITHLVSNSIAKAQDLAFSAAQEFGMPVIDLDAFMRESFPEKLVAEK